MTSIDSIMTKTKSTSPLTVYRTPPRSISPGTPPNAPSRLRREESLSSTDSTDNVARILLPSFDDQIVLHKGKGILAGDFIKPDPSATCKERQTHILSELHRWLSGRIQFHARDVGLVDMDKVEIADMVDDGLWPAARLHMLVEARVVNDSREAPELIYHEMATWATSICIQYLIDCENADTDNSMVNMAIGFVRDDRLPDGRTIVELWDVPSVFEPLRTAEPLPGDVMSLDDRIDAMIDDWDKPIAVTLPIWGWVTVSLWVVLYAWIVAFLVGNSGR